MGEKQDEISRFEYSPKVTVVKKETPKFTFGYAEETNYDNGIPGPNSYETAPKFSARSSFNKLKFSHIELKAVFLLQLDLNLMVSMESFQVLEIIELI